MTTIYLGQRIPELITKGAINFYTDEFCYALTQQFYYTDQSVYADIAGFEILSINGYIPASTVSHGVSTPGIYYGMTASIEVNFGDIILSATGPITGIKNLVIYAKNIVTPYVKPIILIAEFDNIYELEDTQSLLIRGIKLKMNGGS